MCLNGGCARREAVNTLPLVAAQPGGALARNPAFPGYLPPGTHAHYATIMAHCLLPEPGERPTAGQVADALAGALRGLGVPVVRAPVAATTSPSTPDTTQADQPVTTLGAAGAAPDEGAARSSGGAARATAAVLQDALGSGSASPGAKQLQEQQQRQHGRQSMSVVMLPEARAKPVVRG